VLENHLCEQAAKELLLKMADALEVHVAEYTPGLAYGFALDLARFLYDYSYNFNL
jgi:hypothetical protein